MPLTNGCYSKHNASPAPVSAVSSPLSTQSNEPLKAIDRAVAPHIEAESPEAAGRYLVLVGGCNDCHTPDWDTSNGRLPESAWLTGKSVGFRGPWGTTYPKNLRLAAQERTEREWVRMFREQAFKPPMPSMNYRNIPERDLVAIHRFLRALGPTGRKAPPVLPPGQEPRTPYILLVPQEPMQ
jgi:mono/diheme cytochrome c family protein